MGMNAAAGGENNEKHEMFEKSKRMQLYKKQSSSLGGMEQYQPADEDEGYSLASEVNMQKHREELERLYLSKVNNGGMAQRNRPVPRGGRRFIGN